MGTMSDASQYDPALTERLLEEGDQRLHESRRLLEDLDAVVSDER